MKGYLTTCDGAQFELPTLLKWEFSYTGSVPCDSFTLKCAYEPAMAETLRRAVRFTAREDGTVEFAGVVDECGVTCDEKRWRREVSGRGMAALLLDNEAESVSYQWATMEEILKNHVTPYGIVCTGYDAVTAAARYRVANGSSQWKALNDFAALNGGIAPYFDKTGALEVKKNRKAARVSIDAKTPVTALSYCDKRYGVIADYMHLGGKDDDEKVALLIQYLRGMNDDLNIPHCIGHYGPDSYPAEQGFVPENVFLERLPEIAKNAIADACTGSNPRQPTQEEMEKLLKCCYYDTEVDF